MKKKITIFALTLCCLLILSSCCFHKEWYAATCTTPKTCVECGETEGESLGHNWAEATCTAPKTCSTCAITEGESLGHNWVDATTEAPKTCSTCTITEGERIITDPRFTTASTKGLHGTWTADSCLPAEKMGLDGIETDAEFTVVYTFSNDGIITVEFTATNAEEFAADMRQYIIDSATNQLLAAGYSQEEINKMAMDTYGMTMEEYAAQTVKTEDLANVISKMSFSGVYYVEGGQIFNGNTWSSDPNESTFTLDGDSLTISGALSAVLDGDMILTRIAE